MARLPNFLVIIRSEKLSGKGQGRGCLGVRKKERFVLGKRTFRSQKSKHFVLRIIYDFPDNIVLQAILKKQYENEKKVAAICHGVCGLLNVTLASGEYLVKDKKLTGFSRAEEILARKERGVPFDLETELNDRGARYEKALIPMTSKVVIDGNLFTGENPFSSKKMAEVILQCFSKK